MSEDNIPPDTDPSKKDNLDNEKPMEETLADYFGFGDEEETPEEILEDRNWFQENLARAKESIAQYKTRIAQANETLEERQREIDLAIESLAQEAQVFENEKIKDFIEDLKIIFEALGKELTDILSTAMPQSASYIKGAQAAMKQLTVIFNDFSQPGASSPAPTVEQPAGTAIPKQEASVEAVKEAGLAQKPKTEDPESIRAERDALKKEFIALGPELNKLEQEYSNLRSKAKDIQESMPKVLERQRNVYEKKKPFALEKVLKKILPALDTLDRGVSFISDDQKMADIALSGFVSCMQKSAGTLSEVFSRHGISIINPPCGAEMDYDKHQAIATDDKAEVLSDAIVKVESKGYELNGRIIRTAQVIVRS